MQRQGNAQKPSRRDIERTVKSLKSEVMKFRFDAQRKDQMNYALLVELYMTDPKNRFFTKKMLPDETVRLVAIAAERVKIRKDLDGLSLDEFLKREYPDFPTTTSGSTESGEDQKSESQ